jgi:hypothetical protein
MKINSLNCSVKHLKCNKRFKLTLKAWTTWSNAEQTQRRWQNLEEVFSGETIRTFRPQGHFKTERY